jgi:hypothetical protein
LRIVKWIAHRLIAITRRGPAGVFASNEPRGEHLAV